MIQSEAPTVVESTVLPDADTAPGSFTRSRAAIGCFVLGSTLASMGIFSGDSVVEPSYCPPPSHESVEAVTDMLDHPQIFEKPASQGVSLYTLRDSLPELRQREAQLGLHYPVVNKAEQDALVEAFFTGYADRSAADYVSYTQSILGQMGITVHIGTSEVDADKAQTPTEAELDTKEAKRAILDIADYFADQSLEQARLAGIKQIDITSHAQTDPDHPDSLLGEAFWNEGTVLIDISSSKEQNSGVIDHETVHMDDKVMCGGDDNAYNDTYYASLNTHPVYRNGIGSTESDGNRPVPFQDLNLIYKDGNYYTGVYKDDLYRVKVERELGDIKGANELQQQADGLVHDTEVYSDYGYTNVVEDKADLGKNMFNPRSYSEMSNLNKPVIREKFITLMARMYDKSPAVVKDMMLRYGAVKSIFTGY